MLSCWLLFLAASFQPVPAQLEANQLEANQLEAMSQLEANCVMKLHNESTEIGKVIFKSEGNHQRIKINLESDPEIITEGYHGFHVHDKPVEGNNCGPESTGDHFNPDGSDHGRETSLLGQRHVGDLGNLRAGARGEINHDLRITVEPLKPEGGIVLVEPVQRCEPYLVKVWADGREEPLLNIRERKIFLAKRRHRRRKRGRRGEKEVKRELKKRNCSKNNQKKGRCTAEPAFAIKEVHPDCYVPKSMTVDWNAQSPKFYLHGYQSIVGKSVVLHAGRDDLGQNKDGSHKTGHSGARIACCTLVLAEEN